MSPQQSELGQLIRLVHAHWRLILAPAVLAAVTVLVFSTLLTPRQYGATVLLAVHPRLIGDWPYDRSVRIQRALIESDAVVQKTAAALAADGDGSETEVLITGRQLSTRVVNMKDGAEMSPVLALTARRGTPERAAATANTWARIAIAESRAMFARGAPGEQAWLDEMAGRIETARRRLAALEEDREGHPMEGRTTGSRAGGEPKLREREIELARNRLETLTTQVDRRTVATLFKRQEPLTVMAPAVPPRTAETRRLPTKVATASFLGGMLGLMIALARQSRPL